MSVPESPSVRATDEIALEHRKDLLDTQEDNESCCEGQKSSTQATITGSLARRWRGGVSSTGGRGGTVGGGQSDSRVGDVLHTRRDRGSRVRGGAGQTSSLLGV